jgi:pyruvate ferredoxin oxidoreductase alpha subunit
MGKTKHLLKEGSQEMLQMFDKEVERRWRQLKAKHESPDL